jgi:hypothetical protein
MSEDLRTHLELVASFQKDNGAANGSARFMLDHGRSFEFGPDSFAGKRDPAQECFRNAAVRALWDDSVTYVEGYVQVVVALEHAWLIDNKTGRVIDPTIRKRGGAEGYFGVPIKRDYLRKTINRNKYYGVFYWQNWGRVLADNPADIVAKLEYGASNPHISTKE